MTLTVRAISKSEFIIRFRTAVNKFPNWTTAAYACKYNIPTVKRWYSGRDVSDLADAMTALKSIERWQQ